MKAVGTSIARLLHVITPVVVIIAALALQFTNHPLSVSMFIAMVCGGSGPKMLHDFLQQKIITGTLTENTRTITETIVHEARDSATGIQATR